MVCRVRPAGANPADMLGQGGRAGKPLVVCSGKAPGTIKIGAEPDSRSFVFDYLAGETSTQEELQYGPTLGSRCVLRP